jgi:hypothetical protein
MTSDNTDTQHNLFVQIPERCWRGSAGNPRQEGRHWAAVCRGLPPSEPTGTETSMHELQNDDAKTGLPLGPSPPRLPLRPSPARLPLRPSPARLPLRAFSNASTHRHTDTHTHTTMHNYKANATCNVKNDGAHTHTHSHTCTHTHTLSTVTSDSLQNMASMSKAQSYCQPML